MHLLGVFLALLFLDDTSSQDPVWSQYPNSNHRFASNSERKSQTLGQDGNNRSYGYFPWRSERKNEPDRLTSSNGIKRISEMSEFKV